ncbi:hypothetical protein PUNSTDRAFT_42378 [Punctularia strigosozonata HHB-11173 SS5]|uniref:uncharacterized protein n=1 Tax=Punctularia strigosozonata (strain HHB-11173) TaxID=741275 RepID=UPI0004417214|nr:uncharacterized protein PUNSTDRAFT_42378 [Punctularia strigosozonata HHB-11173 SS5]EIN12918.1 hypothetical protein PUNSTDRAFT_42378 [Punctularia strigosozonata HHB-11173 SS5]
MATVDYVEIPPYAAPLRSSTPSSDNVHPARRIVTSLPHPEELSSSAKAAAAAASVPSAASPAAAAAFSLPAILLSSLPSNGTERNPRHAEQLLSTRDPLSIPITTVNFRRFVSKVGPVFWLQDRMEEILMWRRGWRVTSVWMASYAFLCYFPRLVLLLPLLLPIGVLLATYPSHHIASYNSGSTVPPVPTTQPGEGSVDWQANIQGIQNLMGAVADLHDYLIPLLPHLTHQSVYSKPLLVCLSVLAMASLPLLYTLPMRPTFLVLGLAPFGLTHPLIRGFILPRLLAHPSIELNRRRMHARLVRAVDDDRLEDKHWRSEMREVELFENERFAPRVGAAADGATGGGGASGSAGEGAWSKMNLRHGERLAWTRGRDGWSAVQPDGSGEVSSNLTFSLAPGWTFVETEDWRPDVEGTWIECGSDEYGWVYSNDAWQDASAAPKDEWISAGQGMTRRRRWVRRIYYAGTVSSST